MKKPEFAFPVRAEGNILSESGPLHIDEGVLNAFVTRVGERVRKSRQERGFSGKRLSEISGVSLRYLSLLENGKGNISITLLYKLGCALGYPAEWFLMEADPWADDCSQLIRDFHTVSPYVQQQVLALLDTSKQNRSKCLRLCLIGLRGAGKSTLGKSLATMASVPFLELNRKIEDLSGMTVAELMSLYGQEGYRRLERQALEGVVESTRSVVMAAAGGVVSSPETYQFVQQNFHTVWLKAAPEEHMERVRAQGDSRPMAGNPAAMEELKTLLTSRESLYTGADHLLDTTGKSQAQSEQELFDVTHLLLKQELAL